MLQRARMCGGDRGMAREEGGGRESLARRQAAPSVPKRPRISPDLRGASTVPLLLWQISANVGV